MNTNDNVFFSYSCGAVMLDDSASANATESALYWDDSAANASESDAAERARVCIGVTGDNSARYPQRSHSQPARAIGARLAA